MLCMYKKAISQRSPVNVMNSVNSKQRGYNDIYHEDVRLNTYGFVLKESESAFDTKALALRQV